MSMIRMSAFVYALASGVVAAFQIALALGAPWGSFAMGGAFPGQYPPLMRVTAVVLALILALMAGVVLARAGVALPRWSRSSRWLVWVIVAYGAIGTILNLITPSGGERLLWAPVAAVMFVSALVVARSSARVEPGRVVPGGV